MRMVITSLGQSWPARSRCWPAASWMAFHCGAKRSIKSSTSQNNSSTLMARPLRWLDRSGWFCSYLSSSGDSLLIQNSRSLGTRWWRGRDELRPYRHPQRWRAMLTHKFIGESGNTLKCVALLIHAFALEHHTLLGAEFEQGTDALYDDIRLRGFGEIFYGTLFKTLQLLFGLIERGQHQHRQRRVHTPGAQPV